MKREDLVAKLLPLFLRTVPLETVKFTFNRHAAARISVADDRINVDHLEPQGVVFEIHSTSKISIEKLSQTKVTISFFRKGRKVYSRIRNAEAMLSNLMT